MRYSELKELFEPKPDVTINWSKAFSDESNASIATPSGQALEVNFWEISPGVVSIDFTVNESHELTNHKEEIAVFNGVINSIREYISKHPVKDVLFQVKKTEEGKRLSAYVKMAARLASSLGFRQGSIEELESVDPKLYSRFDNRYSKLLWYTRSGAPKLDMQEDRHPNERPYGPESRPTMPAGTVRVDVSDVYDWYKLGQHISDLEGLGHHDFGKGPPSTILSFGSEEEEHKYIGNLEKIGLTTTDIDPVDPKQPKGMKRQKTDPTYNVNEGKVIGANQLVNVYIRGKHKGESYSKLIAQDFPNKHIDQLIQKLVDKHNVNPNAIVYGIPGQDLEEDWKSAIAKGALAGAVALGGAAQAKAPANPYQSYTNDPIAQIIQKRQDELSAKDKKTIQQVTQHVAQAKKSPEVKKTKETPYQPITGSKLETSLYNFAKKLGLKGTELAAFMAQTAHETDYFKTLSEYSSGEQYEGRKDLGNIYKGDGVKYKGRGFIQITGRYNYTQAAKDLGIDLVKHPELAERPDVAAKVTWWYWKNRVRPNVASFADVKQVTKQINPALRGLEKRRQFTKDFKIAQK
jgi:predicted chitinase